ncbi:MAG: peptide deformylase [Acidobacteria bacterium]|nr:peptide deformylase [Acidobacteriota bacterium]
MALFQRTRSLDGRRREIVLLGHPALRERAWEIAPERFGTRFLRDLGRDLIRTMHEDNGVGLAAPQIAVALRAFAYYVPGDKEADEVPPRVVFNPVLHFQGEPTVLGWEGCLSLPNLRGMVARYPKVHMDAFDVDHTQVSIDAEGFHARVIQHEFDHLDGIVFVDRMIDMTSLMFEDEWERFAEQHDQPVEG